MKKYITLLCLLLSAGAVVSAQNVRYNLLLDNWHKEGGVWYASGEKGDKLWGSGNNGTATLGKNITEPEDEFVAVKGRGKRAARLKSQFVGVLGMGKFASACLYTGHFIKLTGMSGARFSFGIPVSGRPKSLHGYYAYKPGIIDHADKSVSHLKGTRDHGHIEIYLTTWKEPFIVDNSGRKSKEGHMNLSPQTEGVIGYGMLELDKATDGYVEFNIPVVYTKNMNPTYVCIMSSSSKWGGHFTGSTDTVLYLDELELRY